MTRLLILLLLFSSLFCENACAKFNAGLLARAKALASRNYVTHDGDEISTAVQTLNFLGFQLQKNNDPGAATDIADTILEIVGTGNGVGGFRPRTHKRAFLNKTEKELVAGALTKAVEYLQLRGLLGDLSDRILALVGKISPDDRVKKHAAIVSSLMYGASAKATRVAEFNAAKDAWVGELSDDARFSSSYAWLPTLLGDKGNWKYADAYMPGDLSEFNAIEWARLERAVAAEEARDRATYDVPVGDINYLNILGDVTVRDFLSVEGEALIKELETTVISEKAAVLAKVLRDSLENASLKDIFRVGVAVDHPMRVQVTRAIIAMEKFRLLETVRGHYMPINMRASKVINREDIAKRAAAEVQADRVALNVPAGDINYADKLSHTAATIDLMSAEGAKLIEALETTCIAKKAAVLANLLQSKLDALSPAILGANKDRAISAVEGFRKWERAVGVLDKVDPTALEYRDDSKDADNQAILMQLVNAVDKYLYNPHSSLQDLEQLFTYQANDSVWLPEVQAGAKAIPVVQIINPELLATLHAAKSVLSKRQRIINDQKALQRQLMYYGVPEFDVKTGDMVVQRKFMYYFPSTGAQLQCGFGSWGVESHTVDKVPNSLRDEAIRKVKDNLADPDIYAMADKVSGTSSRIISLMDRAKRRKSMNAAQIKAEIVATIQQRIDQAEAAVPLTVRIQMDHDIAQRVNSLTRLPPLLSIPVIPTAVIGDDPGGLKARAREQAIKEREENTQKNVLIQQDRDRIQTKNREEEARIRAEIEAKRPALEEAESKLIPARVTKLIQDNEAKDDGETLRLFQRLKIKLDLGAVDGDVLRDDSLAAYARIVTDLEEQAKAIEGEFDNAKRRMGFWAKVYPDNDEINIWLQYMEKHGSPIPASPIEVYKAVIHDVDRLTDYARDLTGLSIRRKLYFESNEREVIHATDMARMERAKRILQDTKGSVENNDYDVNYDEINIWLGYMEKHSKPISTHSLEILRAVILDSDNLVAYAKDLTGLELVSKPDLKWKHRQSIRTNKAQEERAALIHDQGFYEVRALKVPYEKRKDIIYSGITQVFYTLNEFKDLIESDMRSKFQAGELEFDPNKDWRFVVPTYPAIMAILDNYNIYAWVTARTFGQMQQARGADRNATPIFKTEDGQYVLTNFLPVSNSSKPVSLINMYGGHFEKWIEADDHPRIARSIRHNSKYGL